MTSTRAPRKSPHIKLLEQQLVSIDQSIHELQIERAAIAHAINIITRRTPTQKEPNK